MESKSKPRRSLSLKRSSNQSIDSIYFDSSTTDGLPSLDKATISLIKTTVNKVVNIEWQITQTKSSIASLEAHLVAGTFPPSLKLSPKKAVGAKEVREALQVEFDAHAESMAKAETVIKSKQAVLASKTAELTLLFDDFKSSVQKAAKNTSIDKWTSTESLKTLKDRILDNFKSYLTVCRFSGNLPRSKDKGQSDTMQRNNTDRPMETAVPITSQTLRTYLDNYIVEKKVVCQHYNRKGQHNNRKGQPNNRKGQPKQPRGRSRTCNTVARSCKQSISQNRKPNPSPRKYSVSCQRVCSSSRASVSFVSKTTRRNRQKVMDKETKILC